MELQLVEDAGGKCELRGSGPVDQHVLVARTLLGPSHRTRDVVHVGDQRPLPQIVGVAAGEDEDRHAVVVVAAPAARRLEGPPAGDDRPGGHHLVEDRAVDARRPADSLVFGVGTRQEPLVEAVPAVAEPVAGSFVRSSDEPVEGHGHVENGCGHGVSSPGLSARHVPETGCRGRINRSGRRPVCSGETRESEVNVSCGALID